MSIKPSDDRATDTSPNLLSIIHREISSHNKQAERQRKKRWRIGLSLIVLGPAAVLCSTAEFAKLLAARFPRSSFWFEASDAAFLLLAFVAGFWRWGGAQHQKWIHERLCTEILRRESFLLAAGVGPYLDPGVTSLQVESRLQTIGSKAKDLVELVPMISEVPGRTWRDELEDLGRQARSTLPDLSSAIEHYLKHRVEDQLNWFAGKSGKHAWWASFFERTIQFILIAAVVISLVDFGHALAHYGTPETPSPRLFFFGIALTMVGVAMAGFQALLENERLSRSYEYHSARLEHFASRLRALQSDLVLGKSSSQETQFRFRRIVLDVEGMFSEELMQWRLVMEPRAPHADA